MDLNRWCGNDRLGCGCAGTPDADMEDKFVLHAPVGCAGRNRVVHCHDGIHRTGVRDPSAKTEGIGMDIIVQIFLLNLATSVNNAIVVGGIIRKLRQLIPLMVCSAVVLTAMRTGLLSASTG